MSLRAWPTVSLPSTPPCIRHGWRPTLRGEGESVQVFFARSHHAEAGERGSWAPACSEPGPPKGPFLPAVSAQPARWGRDAVSEPSTAQGPRPSWPHPPRWRKDRGQLRGLRMVKRDRPSVWLWGAQGQWAVSLLHVLLSRPCQQGFNRQWAASRQKTPVRVWTILWPQGWILGAQTGRQVKKETCVFLPRCC